MAWVNISNGTVERLFYDDKGVAIVEKFKKRDGTEGKAYFTGFSEEPLGLSVGDTGRFGGSLSVKVDEWEKDGETRHTAKVTLNNLTFEPADSGGGSEPDPWATGDDSATF